MREQVGRLALGARPGHVHAKKTHAGGLTGKEGWQQTGLVRCLCRWASCEQACMQACSGSLVGPGWEQACLQACFGLLTELGPR